MHHQGSLNQPRDLCRLLRPHQWIKNCFVFAGLLFGHAWGDPHLVLKIIMATIAFSLLSSSIYVINDVVDQESDRIHPKKKDRPIAAGLVSIPAALALSALLMVSAICLSFYISPKALLILIAYAILNIAYSFRLKHYVILDVFCIAGGFMLRILAGTVGVDIHPSKWLILCGLMITLFLGFAKRRAEVHALAEARGQHRHVLLIYSEGFLDQLITICATGVIVTYSLYTMDLDTVRIHRTDNLVYTVPIVAYALFRYMFILGQGRAGGEPSRDLVKDKHIMASVGSWVMATFFFLARA